MRNDAMSETLICWEQHLPYFAWYCSLGNLTSFSLATFKQTYKYKTDSLIVSYLFTMTEYVIYRKYKNIKKHFLHQTDVQMFVSITQYFINTIVRDQREKKRRFSSSEKCNQIETNIPFDSKSAVCCVVHDWLRNIWAKQTEK